MAVDAIVDDFPVSSGIVGSPISRQKRDSAAEVAKAETLRAITKSLQQTSAAIGGGFERDLETNSRQLVEQRRIVKKESASAAVKRTKAVASSVVRADNVTAALTHARDTPKTTEGRFGWDDLSAGVQLTLFKMAHPAVAAASA